MQPGQRQNNSIGGKPHVLEYVEKIKEEFLNFQHEIQSLKNERDKLLHDRNESLKCATMNQEICTSDVLLMGDTTRNLITLVNQFVPALPHDHQQAANAMLDKIKQQYQRIKCMNQSRGQPKMHFPPPNFPGNYASFMQTMNPMQLAAVLNLNSQGMGGVDNPMAAISAAGLNNMNAARNSSYFGGQSAIPQFLMNMQNPPKIPHEDIEENTKFAHLNRKRREPNPNSDENEIPDDRASVETKPSEELAGNGLKSPRETDPREKMPTVNRSFSIPPNAKQMPPRMELNSEMAFRNFCLPYGMFPPNQAGPSQDVDLMALGLVPNLNARNEMMAADSVYKNSNFPIFGTKNAICYRVVNGGQPTPVQFPKECASGVPKSAKLVTILPQSEVVCAVAINNVHHMAYTGGKGRIRGWNLSTLTGSKMPFMHIDCLNNNYVRSIKLTKDGKTLVVGGEDETVSVFDIGNGSVQKKSDLKSGIQACYALSISNDDKLCYVCCSDGMIGVWDLHNSTRIRQFKAHNEGATCIDVSADDSLIWTGGLDNVVNTWDTREDKLLNKYTFPSRVYSLSGSAEWLAVGMELSVIELLNTTQNEKYQLNLHESCVLSLKFSKSGRWLVSTGKDNMLNGWVSPMGQSIFQIREQASVLCCDIASQDEYLIAGCGDNKASVYEMFY